MNPNPPSLPLPVDAVAALLQEIGRRMELAGESVFKVRAYETAALNLMTLTDPLDKLVAQGKLRTIPGVGEAIAEKIMKLHRTGTHPTLELMRAQYPSGLLEMMRVPGVGPKKAIALYEKLQISTLEDLVAACETGKLAKEKGFGAKFQDKVLLSADFARQNEGLMRLNKAIVRATAAVAALKERHPEFLEVVAAGEVRRCCEVCGGMKLVAVTDRSDSLDDMHSSTQIGLFATSPERAGTMLLFATGADEHLQGLRDIAASRGLRLVAEGLYRGSERLPGRTEEEVYAHLGLPFIEPELREGRGELKRALSGTLPKLVSLEDLRGALHCHTDASDGTNTLAEMAEGARKLGLQYFGVCDHSQTAAYAGGLKFDRVQAQQQAADALNAGYGAKGFRILKGIESDILEHGELDYTPAQLATFDFVVASVHSRFQLSKKDQTQRLLAAVRNPFTTILGHPTGRLLLSRPGYEVDVEAVLAECARHGVAVEINADPHRLDLDWRWHQRGLELGCMFAINPDAHDTLAFSYHKWGVAMARKGGIPPEKVLNCMDLMTITKHLNSRKEAAVKTL